LNWKVSIEYSSSIAMTLLKESISKHGIRPDTKLVTDGGPENHGEVSKFISNRENLKQLIAQKDIIQSNSMIESVNKHIKYYYLFKKELKDFENTVTHLSTSVPDYNNKPHGRLNGLTPNEVLNGIIPVKDNYQQDMIKARKNRLKQNRLIECCENK
jgi:hypothetical protein